MREPRLSASEAAAGVRQGLLIGAAVLALVLPPTRPGALGVRPTPATVSMRISAAPAGAEAPNAAISLRPTARHADFRGRPGSPDARRLADWVARTADNGATPFVVLDKRDATVYVFDRSARLIDASPVLLGFAPGDESADGIGTRALDAVASHEKTTPAGRFDAERGHDTTGEDVVWIDYDAAVAMHRVRVVDPRERRLERLRSPDPADRRISYGCVNVPVAFFEHVVAPLFRKAHAPVYVLPETKSLDAVFGAGVTVASAAS